MKIASFTLGTLLLAGDLLSSHGAAQDITLTGPKHGDSPTLPDRKGSGPAPDGPDVDSGRRRLEDTVQIMAVREDKPDADGRRKVTVKVNYVLVSYLKGTLALGFNLKSATHFVPVTVQEVKRGTDDRELSATIVPVTWPDKQPFKVYVSLSAEPHPNQTSLLAAVSQVMKITKGAAPPPAAAGKDSSISNSNR